MSLTILTLKRAARVVTLLLVPLCTTSNAHAQSEKAAPETTKFVVELTSDEMRDYKGTTVIFVQTPTGDVHKFMIANQTHAEFETLKSRLSTTPAAVSELLPSLKIFGSGRDSKPDLKAVKGVDTKWTPVTDLKNLEILSRGCRNYACPYPCASSTACTCAFGPCN